MTDNLAALRDLYPELPADILPQAEETFRQYAALAAEIAAATQGASLTPTQHGVTVSEGPVEPRTLTTIG